MIGFICLFFPAVIALSIGSIIQKEKINLQFFVINYVGYVIWINFLIVLIITFIFNEQASIIEMRAFNNLFSVKYFAISILFACVLPFLFEIIKNNFSVKLCFYENKKNIEDYPDEKRKK